MGNQEQKANISTSDGKLKRRAFFGACAAVGVAPKAEPSAGIDGVRRHMDRIGDSVSALNKMIQEAALEVMRADLKASENRLKGGA